MLFWGKLIGALLGYFLLLPFGLSPLGMILGLMVGHSFDKGLSNNFGTAWEGLSHEEVQTLFFKATFSVMGHVAKADGRVSEAEIALAEKLMDRMGIRNEMRRLAINYFNQGKAADFNLEEIMSEFAFVCRNQRVLSRVFLEVQIQAALADGDMEETEKAIIINLAEYLNFSQAEILRLLELVSNAFKFHGPHFNEGANLEDAYAILGIRQTASDQEVKRAYKKLMAQHHPDKLVAKGLPQDMMEVAKEKTQEIQNAYNVIMKKRKA
ncbi:MAG: co-chaperone DjlA [Pseudomonadota bacterium]